MKLRTWTNAAVVTLGAAIAISAVGARADDDADNFSDWSAPTNLGLSVNTVFSEITPFISRDGRSLYFHSDRPGGFGGNDIWVSTRRSLNDPWGEPENLGPTINTEYNENAPTLSVDGHRLHFPSDRPGGFGGLDLYVSRRHNKRNDFGWRAPTNLGSGVNSFADEGRVAHFEDDETGTTNIYFHSNRPGGIGFDDIYTSVLNEDEDDETFGPAALVMELSSPFQDRIPGIRRDGLEVIVSSNRPGTLGLLDLWASTRAKTTDPWSMPVNLGPAVNSPAIDGGAVLSSRGTVLYFHSTRPGVGLFDIYVSTRSKVDDEDGEDDDDEDRDREVNAHRSWRLNQPRDRGK